MPFQFGMAAASNYGATEVIEKESGLPIRERAVDRTEKKCEFVAGSMMGTYVHDNALGDFDLIL
jgi:hypothetical protein